MTDAARAIGRAHEWFGHNSGWAAPDVETLTEWFADGVCRAPDECLVVPRGWCRHGLASWWLILDDLGDVADLPTPADPGRTAAPPPTGDR